MTPPPLADRVVADIDFSDCERILEPSSGEGSFLDAITKRLAGRDAKTCAVGTNLIGVELDQSLADVSRQRIEGRGARAGMGQVSVHCADFFRLFRDRQAASGDTNVNPLSGCFDLIIGNPPFGGTFDHDIEDDLDRMLGRRLGKKIKKETYAFFIVACAELLRPGGRLVFICSDTLKTIPTMTGLRHYLMQTGSVSIRDLSEFSEETTYPMVLLEYVRGDVSPTVRKNDQEIKAEAIAMTPNLSWGITPELARFFEGPLLGEFFVASSGMTTGKNELFVRDRQPDHTLLEPYRFAYDNAPVTVAYEQQRARLGKLPPKRFARLKEAEARGETQRRVRILPLDRPEVIPLPHPDYKPYNKANGALLYSDPTHYIYWADEGDAVLTYKRTGNWYLRGVGGMPYFGREGLTWQLVASRFTARYLPPGYILDSGAPCAFPKPGVGGDTVRLVIGWLLSSLANRILKTVINHTRNIQSKDFERMPFPWWLSAQEKSEVSRRVDAMILEAQAGRAWSWKDDEVRALDECFQLPDVLPSDCELSRQQDRPESHTGLFASLHTR